MTQQELVRRIAAHPSVGNFSVWPAEGDYYGETAPQIRFGFKVDWRSTASCPSEEELLAVELPE